MSIHIVAGMLALVASAWPQSGAITSKSCAAAAHRQFDFWIGTWDVLDPQGKKVGDSRIERINNGCGLLENWRGASGVVGTSLNAYDATDKQWHQFWIDSDGTRLVLHGASIGGKMILSASAPDPHKPGVMLTQRITWTHNADGSVRQHWETSSNGGATWTTVFDGKYVKKAASQ